MKICIYGAGAIGGLIGTRLAAAGTGTQVAAIARGATLASLRTHGWRTRDATGLTQAAAVATDDPAELGVQDLVVIAVKGPAMPAVAAGIGPLIGPDTVVLPAINGIPWWFGSHLDGPARGLAFESVDPGGVTARAIALSHVVGCVVHASASMPEPGLVEHRAGRGLIIGEPAGPATPRVAALASMLGAAGFEVTVSNRIQEPLWYKLWGNLTMNPISAITGATVDRILDDPLVRDFCTAAMREAAEIGARIGCRIDEPPEARHAVTRKLGAFTTSMLQDVNAGRMLELDSIVAAVRELGARADVPTPNIDALFGLARLFARVRGLYP
jgi:2-dehydropantoate 2-reductase